MNYKKQNFKNYLLHDTQIENLFISEFAKKAPGDFIKVYLLALMYTNAGESYDSLALSKKLDLTVSDIDAAWDFWASEGVIKKYEDASGEIEIEFVNLRDELFGSSANASRHFESSTKESRLSDERLTKLYHDVEKVTGRFLEAKEPETISTWLYNFEIDPSVILLAYRYCTNKKTSNRYRYVEKVLSEWKRKGLESVGDIEEFLGDTDRRYSFYRTVCKELGFMRNPTEPEKRMMDAWIDEYEFTTDEVLEACKKTTGISNPNLNYINSVLMSFKNGDKKESVKKTYTIEELYEKDREKNELELSRRKEDVFSKNPRILEILDELKASGYKISKSILRGSLGKEEIDKERENQRKLLNEKEELLRKIGYSANYLDPIYTCKDCKDTGYLKDGTKCRCFADKVNELRIINE